MEEFPTLYSKNIILRKIDVNDIPNLIKYANSKSVSDNIVNMPYPYREPDAVFRISRVVSGFKNKNRFVFSIILKEINSFIGEVVLYIENPGIGQLGYWIGEPFRRQRIMTEAVYEVLSFGFEVLKLNAIYATTKEGNIGSKKVLINNGMKEFSSTQKMKHYKLTKETFKEQIKES